MTASTALAQRRAGNKTWNVKKT